MPSHEWGDEWFEANGNDLGEAISYCMRFWKRWGRIGSHGKEKYGTFRDSPYLWDGGIWSLIRPGYVSIGGPILSFIYFKLDRYIVRPITRNTGIYRLGIWYQAQVYNYAIQKMCKKFPNIVDELVADLDGYEMVKPGIFGKVDGTVINKKYWRTMGELDEEG
jgi:hypothetical protein